MELAAPQGARERTQQLTNDGAGRMAGSTADLFPKLVTMQQLCSGTGFAVLAAQAQTLLVPGGLVIKMQSPGNEELVSQLLAERLDFLLAHLRSSPRPMMLTSDNEVAAQASLIVTGPALSKGRTDLLFPVQLGAMGNGFIAFFGVRDGIGNELLIELHRKSLMIMREALRLAFGVTPVAEKLNEREIECLQLVGNGMKSEAIGERLQLSVHTVNAYLGSATTKLDAVNRIQAIAKSIRLGIIA
ncbi:response regulator transcription factor [Hoeflea sp.]|uniref:response regulator transcription factor n=2 Tax=Hoeflea sp. TaxID=1940281 RepID=UPI003A928F7C